MWNHHRARLRLAFFQFVDAPVNTFQGAGIGATEVGATGRFGNLPHHRFIETEIVAGNQAAVFHNRNFFPVAAHADGIDTNTFAGGQLRRYQRGNGAGGIFTVGYQYQHPGARRAFAQFLYSEPDTITHGRTVAGNARHQVVEQVAHGLAVQGQR